MSRERILPFYAISFILYPKPVRRLLTSEVLSLTTNQRSTQINQHTIYPYIHSFSNVRSNETLLRGFKIPDVLPSEIPTGPSFSLVAGDFEEIYGILEEDDEREPQQGKWDAVLTCFFIDTVRSDYPLLRKRVLMRMYCVEGKEHRELPPDHIRSPYSRRSVDQFR